MQTKSVLFNLMLDNPDFAEPDNYFVLIGVDYNEIPFILKDNDKKVIKYRDIKKAKTMQTILNMGHLAKYYIEEITE